MLAFVTSVALALDLPDVLAVCLVDGADPGAGGMDKLQVQAGAVQHGSGVHAEAIIEFAVAILGIEAPDLVALEIEAGKVAGADESIDMFPIGTGRTRGAIALVASGGHVA